MSRNDLFIILIVSLAIILARYGHLLNPNRLPRLPTLQVVYNELSSGLTPHIDNKCTELAWKAGNLTVWYRFEDHGYAQNIFITARVGGYDDELVVLYRKGEPLAWWYHGDEDHTCEVDAHQRIHARALYQTVRDVLPEDAPQA